MADSTAYKSPVATGEQDPFLTMLKIFFKQSGIVRHNKAEKTSESQSH